MSATLGLTVLVHEGPMARSYLAVLAASGYRVERVVRMVQRRDVASKKVLAPWLPKFVRQPLARRLQDLRMNHWPREFLRRHLDLCRPWLHSLAVTYGFEVSVYETLAAPIDYLQFADTVDELFVDGLGDPLLVSYLNSLPGEQAVLFTGGGMVPPALLGAGRCRFIHVHPGHLPSVRGADGLLWSMLVRGCPGATAFYMNPGLDMGDILLASDLPAPPVPAGFDGLPPAMAYRLLYSFVDPMLRAVLLRRLVSQAKGPLHALPVVNQCADEGITFHFMNEHLRRVVFSRLSQMSSISEASA